MVISSIWQSFDHLSTSGVYSRRAAQVWLSPPHMPTESADVKISGLEQSRLTWRPDFYSRYFMLWLREYGIRHGMDGCFTLQTNPPPPSLFGLTQGGSSCLDACGLSHSPR